MTHQSKWTVFTKDSPFLFAFITLFLFHPAHSNDSEDFSFTKEISTAYHHFLQLKLHRGSLEITDFRKQHPENGCAILINNYYDFLHLLTSNNNKEYERLKINENIRINKLKALSSNSPYYLYSIAEIKLQWAFLKVLFNDKVSGLWSMRSAYKMIKENHIKYPDFTPNYKILGLLEIILGSTPDENKWILNTLGMKGNYDIGLAYLDTVAQSDHLFAFEAQLYKELAQIYLLKNETDGLPPLKNLALQHQSNPLVQFLYATALSKSGKNEDALSILSHFSFQKEHASFPTWHYTKGTCLLNKLDYSEAQQAFNTFLTLQKGSNFIKSAYYKLYLCHLLNNDFGLMEEIQKKGLIEGAKIEEADQEAFSFFKNPTPPNTHLIKSRLLFDGGYYQKSLQQLKQIPEPNHFEFLEINYRKARNYHGLRDFNNAIRFYKTCIELQKPENYFFFAPNACLQLGYIYQLHKPDKNMAKLYLEKALTYKKYPYKNSINNKAKAALQAL